MPGARRVCTIVVAFVVLALAGTAHAATFPNGFEERTLVGGLTMPTAVDWLPDGRMLILEKSGVVKMARPGERTATTVIDLSKRVNDYHDRGALGLAVDKQFAQHPYVYVLHTYEMNPLAEDGDGEMNSQLLRLRWTADDKLVEPTPILGTYTTGICPAAANTVDCIPSNYDSHSIGTVISAPDGTLYAGSGDASSYNEADPRALRALDERSLAGKIVHIDREGRGLTGHKFCPSSTDLTSVCSKVVARGFRNPFRFALQPDGKTLTVGDVGWNTVEEVNFVKSDGGKSYGWPCYEGTGRTSGYRNFTDCTSEYAKPAGTHTSPDFAYAHRSGVGASVQGGPTYTGDQYPAAYKNSIFFADYSENFIKRLVPGSNGTWTEVDFADGWMGGQVATAPSGDLTYTDFGSFTPTTGSVRQIRYTAGNRAPVARAVADRTSGSAPLTVAFDGRTSTDAEGDALTYSWEFGDGSAKSTAANPTHVYTRAGTYTAVVTVTDELGATDQDSVVITAGNDAPTASITTPANNGQFVAGTTVQLGGAGSDAQDGALPGSSLTWTVVLHHNDHVHPLTDLTGAAPTFRALDDHDADSFYLVTLRVRDSGGLTGEATIRLNPKTAPLSLASQPAGATMSWAGTDFTAPRTATTAVGFRTEAAADDSLTSGGKTYRFARWSDGVTTRARSLVVPDAGVNLTAIYEEAVVTGPQPVLAYGFDADAQASVLDQSGRGANGSVRGATWTSGGKYGGGLRFDGVDDWVTVADRATLDLTSSYTYSAWVKPETSTPWQTLLMKERGQTFSYALYGTSDNVQPSSWSGEDRVLGPDALALNTWTHVAVTQGGGTMRMYVNGVQVGSHAAAAAVPSDGVLRLGGNGIWSTEWFKGVMDDVRIYDQTLDATQIRTIRDTAVGGTTQPPPAPTGPVGAWGFDETSGTTATDGSGRKHDGTISGATRVAGRFGNGLQFDGVDDWVTVADDNDLDLTSPYTLEAWVKPRTRAKWQTVFVKELGTTGMGYGLYATSDTDRPSAWNGAYSVYGPSAVATSGWQHVAVTVADGTQRLYVDGVQVATSSAGFAPQTSGPLRIGGSNVWQTEFFAGTLDELRVYQRALSASEIAADRLTPVTDGAVPPPDPEPEPGNGPVAAFGFGDGSGTVARDSSGAARNGAVSGATWTTAGKNGGALKFDGVNDWVTVADADALDLTTAWTLSAWVRPESTTPWQTIALKEAGAGMSYGLYARSDLAGPSVWTSTSWIYRPAALAQTTWTHVTATMSGGTLRFYVDGVLRETLTSAAAPVPSTGPLRIGGNAVWGEWFKGTIDDVRVYKRALSATEVAADVTTGVAAPASAASVSAARSSSPSAAVSAVAASVPKGARAHRVSRATKVAAGQQRKAARRVVLTRTQKKSAVRRAVARAKAQRARARRKAGKATPQTRSQKVASARGRRR